MAIDDSLISITLDATALQIVLSVKIPIFMATICLIHNFYVPELRTIPTTINSF